MRPFHPPRPNAGHSHLPRLGDPGPSPLHGAPMHQQLNPAAFPPPGTGLAAANPFAAVAATNPFLAMQLFGQAQQLQNLGYLAAAALQQQQPCFPGGFPPNPNQFGAFPHAHAGFNGNGTFRPGGAGVIGSRPPLPMMGAPGNGCTSRAGGAGAPRPMLNFNGKDQNSSGERSDEVRNPTNNKSDGTSHVATENGHRNSTTGEKSQFNPGRDGMQFGQSGGRGRGDGWGGRQFSPSGGRGRGRGRGDGRDGRQFGPTGGRGRGNGRGGRQFSPSGGRGRGRSFNQGRGRGSNDWRDIKSNITSFDSPTSARHRKPPTFIYDTNEVKQWVQARKKNYPTSVNINKKLSQSQSDDQKKDEDAQMRRQELKEVLAKQKELGFELPELPPGYLSETEDKSKGPQATERKCKWKTQHSDDRFGNGAKKRQRCDRKDFQSKRPRTWKNNHHDDVAMVKSREPTLLQKLLSSDIKRDRHRLLHTFKFMVVNNFFRDWPDKPLEFPCVKVNQIELENDIAAEDLDNLQSVEGNNGFIENGDEEDSSVKVNQIEFESDIAGEDLDNLQNADTVKSSNPDFIENSNEEDSGSSDAEAGSKDDSEADEDTDEDTGAEHNAYASEGEFSA